MTEIAAYAGLFAVVTGVGLLLRAAWRGSLTASVLAAAFAIPATWFLYEILRQGLCPLIAEPAAAEACARAYGTMTAPVLSAAVAVIVFAVGWLGSQLTQNSGTLSAHE